MQFRVARLTASYKTSNCLHLEGILVLYMLIPGLEMCKFGKHVFCVNILNTVEVFSGLVGVILLGVGIQFTNSVAVTVGKVPFAWLVGIVSIVFGVGGSLTVVTSIPLKVKSNDFWVHLVFGVLMVGSGTYNIVQNPRSDVICNCLPGYYGSDNTGFLPTCLECDCGNGLCADTVYGDGSCICPPRYDPDSQCSVCIAGATGDNCERCKVGWKYESNLSKTSCTKCYDGYRKYQDMCDYTAVGVITHTCMDGWETECYEQVAPLPPWDGTNPSGFVSEEASNCMNDYGRPRTVVCDKCEANHNTRACKPCNCTTSDPDAICPLNQERSISTLSVIECYDDYDCDSFHCSDGYCTNEIREGIGCQCSANFAGPTCERCVDNPVDVGFDCVKGVCQYHAAKEEKYCLCSPGYESPNGYCSKQIQTGECESNYWGPDCKACTCQNGICSDTSTGNGKCRVCQVNENIFTGYGMWDGENCDVCAPGQKFVGCGDTCYPQPEFMVNHTEFGPRSVVIGPGYGEVCGEVQRCDRAGMDPCLIDCLASGGECLSETTTIQTGVAIKSSVYVCEDAPTLDPWYICTCSTGTYIHDSGCKTCPSGKYQDQTGQTSCKTCPSGKYQDQDGQTSCMAVPDGQISVVDIAFGYSKVTACAGVSVRVTWAGEHNIQETVDSSCNSEHIGGVPITGYHSSGHQVVYINNELTAAPGTTRYFKCDRHCGLEASRFEVTCPQTT